MFRNWTTMVDILAVTDDEDKLLAGSRRQQQGV
jgi:hypothetical protein